MRVAVSDKDARSANQIGIAASELPVQNLGLGNAAASVHLPRAEQQERQSFKKDAEERD